MGNALQVWLNSLASGGNFGGSFLKGWDQAGKAADEAQARELRKKQLELQNKALDAKTSQFSQSFPLRQAQVGEQVAAGQFNRSNEPVNRKILGSAMHGLDPQAMQQVAGQLQSGGSNGALQNIGALGDQALQRRVAESSQKAAAAVGPKVEGQKDFYNFKRANPLSTPNSPENMRARYAHDEYKAAQANFDRLTENIRKSSLQLGVDRDIPTEKRLLQAAQQRVMETKAAMQNLPAFQQPDASDMQLAKPDLGPQGSAAPLPGPSMASGPHGSQPPNLFQNGTSGLPQSAPDAHVYALKPGKTNPAQSFFNLPEGPDEELHNMAQHMDSVESYKQQATAYLQSKGLGSQIPMVLQTIEKMYKPAGP